MNRLAPPSTFDPHMVATTPFDPWRTARTAAKRRIRRSFRERLSDLYIRLFSLVVVGSVAASVLQLANAESSDGTPWLQRALIDNTAGLPASVALILIIIAFAGFGVWALLATGPIAASRADLIWGFQLPVDRSPYLRRAFNGVLFRGLLSGVMMSAMVLLAVISIAGPSWSTLPLFVAVAASGPVVSALAVLAQTRTTPLGQGHTHSRFMPWAVCLVILSGAVYGLLTYRGLDGTVTTGPAASAAGWVPGWSLSLLVAFVTVALLVVVLRKARRGVTQLDWPQLEAGAGHAIIFRAAAATFDIQDLYRALIRLPHQNLRPTILSPRGPVRPWVAMWRAETTGWLRLIGPFPLWLATLGAVLMVATAPGWGTVAVLIPALVVTALLAADIAASAPRTSMLTPDLEAVLPISSLVARIVRLATPCALMALWGSISLGAIGVLTGTPLLVLPGALAGVGIGATAVAGARRPPLDWSGAVIMMDSGAIPIGVIVQLTGTHVMGVLILIPTAIAVVTGALFPLVCAQAIFSLSAVAWSMHQQRKS